jgi:putative aldouronate transport system permease protein
MSVKAARRIKFSRADFEQQTMAWLGLSCLIIFSYMPMLGLLLAFKDGNGALNITEVLFYGDWVGIENFTSFFRDINFRNVFSNTLILNLISFCINFPGPIIFALALNEIKNGRFKRTVQTIIYLPHFLSWVIFAGIMLMLLSGDGGFVNELLTAMRIIDAPINFIAKPQYAWVIIIGSSFLKNVGWGTIIYLAAIAGIDTALYEAAEVDGANRFHKLIYITLPSIAQTITLFALLSISNLLDNGTEQILIYQNALNISRSEVIDTFVLKYGITRQMFSYASAIGLFKSVISVILLTSTNFVSKRMTGRGIF